MVQQRENPTKMPPEAIGVLLQVVYAFDQLDIPYMIGGSMASAVHGVTRSTIDADLIAEINPEQAQALVEMLDEAFYVDREMILDAILYRGSFNMIHLQSMFKIDVFIRKERPFERKQFERRTLQVLANHPEQSAYVATAEDIILAKLEWYRQGGEVSDRQWRDILGVMKVQTGLLDVNYLTEWADELRVADLLQKALAESS